LLSWGSFEVETVTSISPKRRQNSRPRETILKCLKAKGPQNPRFRKSE